MATTASSAIRVSAAYISKTCDGVIESKVGLLTRGRGTSLQEDLLKGPAHAFAMGGHEVFVTALVHVF